MTDSHYIIYQYIDRHPVIFILMMTVVFAWTYGLSRKKLVRVIKGDKSAAFSSSVYSVLAILMMAGVFHVLMEHLSTITGHEVPTAYIHEHRYDIINEDSILHSPLCGCKQQDSHHPHEEDSTANRWRELIIKSVP